MRKRLHLSQNPSDQHHFNPNDIVSRMPDEILVSILSRLPLVDAAVTSQLSRRWRYMWCRTLKLDLEDDYKMYVITTQPRLLFPERNRFINWVNLVMRHHKSPKIESFRIGFDLDKHSKGAITKWIQFALSKNVETLELDLRVRPGADDDSVRNFIFPNKILNQKSGSSSGRRLLNAHPRMPSKVMGIKCLKVLILKCVNVNDETIGKILRNCPVLEHLHICNSGQLVNVNVSGPALALTKLEIQSCFQLQSIEIYDSNLVWFEYLGIAVDLKLHDNPRLKTISIGEGYFGIQKNTFQQLSCVKYLEVLEMHIFHPKKDTGLISFPELPTVKKLSMIVGAFNDDSLLGLTWWVKLFPNLQKCTIQLRWTWKPERIEREIENWVKHTHHHLEVVEMIGFYGGISDLELALYFYESCIALKKIVIDPTYQLLEKRSPVDSITDELLQENKARYAAHLMLHNRIAADKLVIV